MSRVMVKLNLEQLRDVIASIGLSPVTGSNSSETCVSLIHPPAPTLDDEPTSLDRAVWGEMQRCAGASPVHRRP